MMKAADAVVIGGGIIGASVGHFLAKLGYGDVVLLEKRRLAGGSTRYSAAHVRQHYTNEVAIRLARRAAAMFADAETELGGEVGFVRDGYLVLASREGAAAIREVVPFQQELGVDTSILTPDQVADRWPELDLDGVELACFEETSGYADPVRTVEALARSGVGFGLDVREGCEVLDVEAGGGRVTGVRTSEGPITTEVVVNATGPWGNSIGAMVGVEYPLTWSREHEAIFHAPNGFRGLPVVSDSTQQLYFRSFGQSKVLVGAGWPKQPEPADPETYDDGTDDEHIGDMVPKLARRVPALAGLDAPSWGGALVTGYSGVYDITEDWYPIVGAEDVGGYYSAFGGSGHCFKLGPTIGESLAHMICGSEPPVDISSLAGRRFAEGGAFTSVWGAGNRA